jgi:hypothetical protein
MRINPVDILVVCTSLLCVVCVYRMVWDPPNCVDWFLVMKQLNHQADLIIALHEVVVNGSLRRK